MARIQCDAGGNANILAEAGGLSGIEVVSLSLASEGHVCSEIEASTKTKNLDVI